MKSSFWNGTMFGDRNVFVLSVTNSCRVPLWTQLKGSYSSNCLCLCDHIYGSVQSDLWIPAHGREVWQRVCQVECWIVMFHNLNCFNCTELTAIQVEDRIYSLQCLSMIQRM